MSRRQASFAHTILGFLIVFAVLAAVAVLMVADLLGWGRGPSVEYFGVEDPAVAVWERGVFSCELGSQGCQALASEKLEEWLSEGGSVYYVRIEVALHNKRHDEPVRVQRQQWAYCRLGEARLLTAQGDAAVARTDECPSPQPGDLILPRGTATDYIELAVKPLFRGEILYTTGNYCEPNKPCYTIRALIAIEAAEDGTAKARLKKLIYEKTWWWPG